MWMSSRPSTGQTPCLLLLRALMLSSAALLTSSAFYQLRESITHSWYKLSLPIFQQVHSLLAAGLRNLQQQETIPQPSSSSRPQICATLRPCSKRHACSGRIRVMQGTQPALQRAPSKLSVVTYGAQRGPPCSPADASPLASAMLGMHRTFFMEERAAFGPAIDIWPSSHLPTQKVKHACMCQHNAITPVETRKAPSKCCQYRLFLPSLPALLRELTDAIGS